MSTIFTKRRVQACRHPMAATSPVCRRVQLLTALHSAPPSSHSYQGCRNKACIKTHAALVERGHANSWSPEKTKERVLRYPGGQERRIRYPAAAIVEEEESVNLFESFERLSEWWGVDRYYYSASSDEEEEDSSRAILSEQPTTSGRSGDAGYAPTQTPPSQGLPSTPDELLRYINSDSFKSARAEQLRLVRSSYQLLEGSPWLQTKPLYVLATQQPSSETASTFTLRTRMQQKDAEDQLTKVLGRRRPDGSSLIRCEELKDGVVSFEDEADAHRFASLLEADGTEALVAECDAHELFREIRAVRAVVVLVKECAGLNCHLPMPEELAAALRGQRSLDDLADL